MSAFLARITLVNYRFDPDPLAISVNGFDGTRFVQSSDDVRLALPGVCINPLTFRHLRK